MENLHLPLAAYCTAWRQRRGLTRAGAARLLKIDMRAWVKIEDGDADPRHPRGRLRGLLHVALDALDRADGMTGAPLRRAPIPLIAADAPPRPAHMSLPPVYMPVTKPKKRFGRLPWVNTAPEAPLDPTQAVDYLQPSKRGPGRPRLIQSPPAPDAPPVVKRGRGRPRKIPLATV